MGRPAARAGARQEETRLRLDPRQRRLLEAAAHSEMGALWLPRQHARLSGDSSHISDLSRRGFVAAAPVDRGSAGGRWVITELGRIALSPEGRWEL